MEHWQPSWQKGFWLKLEEVDVGQEKKQPKVVIYSTPSCPWCVKAKRYLKEKGIRFKDVDVSKDSSAAQDMIRKTGQLGVPVVLIGDKPVVGFNRPLIDRLLEVH